MIEIGTILRSFIGKNRDAEENTVQHSTEMIEEDDIQTVEQIHIPGFQYNPPVSSRGFVARIGRAWRIMMGIFDLVGRVSLNPGEIILYSSSGGSVAASIRWNADGSIDLAAPGDFNITANLNITGNTVQTGTIDTTGNISSEADMISDSAGTAISSLNHPHIGDLGFNTGAPVPVGGGVAPPGSIPTYDSGTNTADLKGIDLDNVGTISTTVGTHTHPSPAGGNTGQPN